MDRKRVRDALDGISRGLPTFLSPNPPRPSTYNYLSPKCLYPATKRRSRFFMEHRLETIAKFLEPDYLLDAQGQHHSTTSNPIESKIWLVQSPLTQSDPLALQEGDRFYDAVQLERSWYKDRSGRRYPLKYFCTKVSKI